jgi:hypothetical protein
MTDQINKHSELLTSWKEIAAHLGKGVRTVQRWEQELGLPVRRPAKSRHIVVALAPELDKWIEQLSQPLPKCCTCKDELEAAKHTMADLRLQVATLESELNAALVALQGRDASQTVAGAGIVSTRRAQSDGNAA